MTFFICVPDAQTYKIKYQNKYNQHRQEMFEWYMLIKVLYS